MSASDRLEFIRALEDKLQARLLVYFCGDHPAAPGRLGTDVLRSMYAQLTHMELPSRDRKLVLLLYGIGGHVNSAWKIATLLRQFSDTFHVLVPYKAHSAATLLALGSDRTVMTKMASLSPFDPALEIDDDAPVSVHDILAYAKLAQTVSERLPENSRASVVAAMLSNFVEKGGPLILGQAYRLYRHVSMVAEQLLDLHRPAYEEGARKAILRTLVEKGCLHSHVIRRSEARGIGLDVEDADDELCRLSWALCQQYMDLLSLDGPADFDNLLLPDEDRVVVERFPVAMLESVERCHTYRGTLQVTRKRDLSALREVKVDPDLFLYAATLGPEVTEELTRQLTETTKRLVLQQLQQLTETQSDAHLRGAVWRDITAERTKDEFSGEFRKA